MSAVHDYEFTWRTFMALPGSDEPGESLVGDIGRDYVRNSLRYKSRSLAKLGMTVAIYLIADLRTTPSTFSVGLTPAIAPRVTPMSTVRAKVV